MYRFFADEDKIKDGTVIIEGSDAHHIKNVLRMKTGDKINISFGNEIEYICEISGFEKEKLSARIVDMQKTARELSSKITLYQCLPKKNKMELIIQKAVELGAFRIVPVISSRCVVKIDPKKNTEKIKRFNTIAQAAAKQAKRLIEPEITPALSFDRAIDEIILNDIALIPYEKEEGIKTTRQLLGNIIPGQSIGVIIGPEGGFDDAEYARAVNAGVNPITLGKRILRTETAPIAVLSILMYLLEED